MDKNPAYAKGSQQAEMEDTVGRSVINIKIADNTEQTSACKRFNRKGSTFGAKISTNVICTANINAQPIRSRSPMLICVTPTQLRKYSPITATATLIGIMQVTFFFRKMPMIGTITIYIAVRKPDFPASVLTIPSC